jgi:glycosyltransferase involved in cell wall biosynthesis
MRQAFRQLGAQVTEVDECVEQKVSRRLQDIFDRTPVSMIYERYALGRSSAARFALEQNIPYVLEVNAPLAEEPECWRSQLESRKDREEDQVAFAAASCITTVSSVVAKYAKSRGGRNEAICICPNGIDSSLFRTDIKDRKYLPQRPPAGRFVLGFHGRERPCHGFEILVDVTRTLLARSYSVHLYVIGNGEFKELARLPPGTYTRKGWVEHEKIPAYISTFHAMPLTYSPETPCYFSPLKLVEGMACGVVPLVPALGDLPEIVEQGVTGWVYPAGDSGALIDHLVALISNRSLHREMSTRAAIAAKSHEWRSIARKVLEYPGLSQCDQRFKKTSAG